MKRYSNYEFISARWYNQIPIHWHLIRIKDLISQSNAGAWGDDPETDNGTICLRVADMDFNLGVFKNKPVSVLTKRLYTEEQIEKLTLEQGDILIEKSGGGEKSPVGRSVYFDKSYPALFANFMQRIRFKHKLIDAHFASYLLRTMYYRGATWYYVKQTTGIQNLDLNSMLAQERFPVPPREEQDQIVRYLDWQVSKINRLIAAKRKQIALLHEQHKRRISEAVLHGNDDGCCQKDSGVEWIGMIPEHWSVIRCKYVFTERDERSIAGEEEHLSMSQKYGLVPDSKLDERRMLSESYVGGKICYKNDLVLNRLKAHLGVFALSPQKGVISPDYTVLVPNAERILPTYGEAVLKSDLCRRELRIRVRGIIEGFWRLYTDDFNTIVIPLPTLKEQRQIMEYIGALDEKSIVLKQNLEKEIVVLQDLRTRLISDVVTGQIDVRGIKVPDDEYINNEITEEEFEEESENNEEE
jgi:type I restriction-modification system specificity subunit